MSVIVIPRMGSHVDGCTCDDPLFPQRPDERCKRYAATLCVACEAKQAVKSRQLCGGCYAAAYRRTKLGDTWDQAVEDRRWMLKRRRVKAAGV